MTPYLHRNSPYNRFGGELAVRNLVKAFYNVVENDPVGLPLLAMHNRGHGVSHAREAQFEFLSGFLGGPQLYIERHQHSNVKQMHAHLRIGSVEREAWLYCMRKALHEVGADVETREILMQHFTRVAGALTTAD